MSKGKILFMSFEEAMSKNLDNYDIKLQIVRYTRQGKLKGFVHVPQLAPSEELFNKTMNSWKKLKFTKEERTFIRNGKTKTWFDLYEIEFIKQMENDKIFIKNYKRLKEHLLNGKNIVAICYCENYKRCHRYIIAQKLINEGFNVCIK